MGKRVTLEDFARYRFLRREILRLGRQIVALRRRRGQIVSDSVTGSSPEPPYTQHSIRIVGLVDNADRIAEKERRLAAYEAEARTLGKRLAEFLRFVADEEVRETLELYYIDGLRYRDIPAALGLVGDGSTQIKAARKYVSKRQAVKPAPPCNF